MGFFTAGAAAVLRGLLAHEELPVLPPTSEHTRPSASALLALLFGPEPLPSDLPPAPEATPRRASLALLFAAEPLPFDLPPAPRRHGRWLAWLLAAEPLDP